MGVSVGAGVLIGAAVHALIIRLKIVSAINIKVLFLGFILFTIFHSLGFLIDFVVEK
jgi:hypothetical protein